MATLIEELPARIARLKSKHGSDDPFVKDWKVQLRAIKENVGKSTQDVYLAQTHNFSLPSKAAPGK